MTTLPPHDSFESDSPVVPCPGCGAPLHDAFCSSCGERRPAHGHGSLRELAEDAVESFMHLDSTLMRSVRTLFRSPGALTAAYMRGDRVRYTRPLQLFLLANLAFFLLAGPLHVHVVATPLAVHMHATPYRLRAAALVEARLEQRGTTLDAYAPIFDAAATTQAKSLVIIMVPAFALLVALVNRDRHRPALQHVVFALHFYVVFFAVLLGLALIAAAVQHIDGVSNWQAIDTTVTILAVIAMTAYQATAESRAYDTIRGSSLLRGFLLAIGAFLILILYRALLFFITFYTT